MFRILTALYELSLTHKGFTVCDDGFCLMIRRNTECELIKNAQKCCCSVSTTAVRFGCNINNLLVMVMVVVVVADDAQEATGPTVPYLVTHMDQK